MVGVVGPGITIVLRHGYGHDTGSDRECRACKDGDECGGSFVCTLLELELVDENIH